MNNADCIFRSRLFILNTELFEKSNRTMKKFESTIIFATANPDPEISPEEVSSVRTDAIMATGRSDYPNQVNNVLCFPFSLRRAPDV